MKQQSQQRRGALSGCMWKLDSHSYSGGVAEKHLEFLNAPRVRAVASSPFHLADPSHSSDAGNIRPVGACFYHDGWCVVVLSCWGGEGGGSAADINTGFVPSGRELVLLVVLFQVVHDR